MSSEVEILNLHCGERINHAPIIVVAVPVQQNGGMIDSKRQVNPAVLSAEKVALTAVERALNKTPISDRLGFNSFVVVKPTDFIVEHSDTGLPLRVFSTQRCFEITKWADGMVAVNQSDNARSEGIAVQLGWSAGYFEVPSLYVSEHKIERVGPWLQNLSDQRSIEYFHALGDEAVEAAIDVFFERTIKDISIHAQERIDAGVELTIDCDAELVPRGLEN